MLTKLWEQWKNIKANDPVKARLVHVLLYAAVVVLPFLSVWIYGGFAKAMGMVIGLIVTGLCLLLLAASINWCFGWAAHYVLTGKLPEADDFFDNTILDEWESYQNHQYKASLRPQTSKQTKITQVQMGGKNNVQKNDSGPDWLK